jgi:hypothetical protein
MSRSLLKGETANLAFRLAPGKVAQGGRWNTRAGVASPEAEPTLPDWQAAMTKDRRGTWAINQMPINVAPRKFERSRRLPEAGEAQPPRMIWGSDASADRISGREPGGGNGLRQSELISPLGYKDISRGLRSLARLSAGDLDGYPGLIPKLPSALQVDPESGP